MASHNGEPSPKTFEKRPLSPHFCTCPVEGLPNEMFNPLNGSPIYLGQRLFLWGQFQILVPLENLWANISIYIL